MIPFLDASRVLDLGYPAAADAVEAALRSGFDPDDAPPRSVVDLQHGQGLLMPAEVGDWFGVKIATISPGNPGLGLPRIQGSYVLHDARTLTPTALLDAVALTTLRTAGVSLAAIRPVLRRSSCQGYNVLVFGSGPQAQAHLDALASTVTLGAVTVVARTVESAERIDPGEAPARALRHDELTADDVEGADLIIAATTAREPLFDGRLVADHAVVVAVGSHEPQAREVDEFLLGRSTVIVESRPTARRECGDVLAAVAAGALGWDQLRTLADVALGQPLPQGRPVVFKSAGMAWEDLVVAAAVYRTGAGEDQP